MNESGPDDRRCRWRAEQWAEQASIGVGATKKSGGNV